MFHIGAFKQNQKTKLSLLNKLYILNDKHSKKLVPKHSLWSNIKPLVKAKYKSKKE